LSQREEVTIERVKEEVLIQPKSEVAETTLFLKTQESFDVPIETSHDEIALLQKEESVIIKPKKKKLKSKITSEETLEIKPDEDAAEQTIITGQR